MIQMYDEFFAKANELVQEGVPFVTALVVRAEKPTSAKPGDKAIITADGVMVGWIGGSCAQPAVIKEALKALAADESRLIRLSTDPEAQSLREGLIDLSMTCFSGGTLEIYIEPQYPRPRLLIVGTLPVAQALVHLGKAMNYHVVVVDLNGSDTAVPAAGEVFTSLDDLQEQVRPHTYVVVATHGNYDELALEKVLKAHPTYVGLVASPTRANAVREYLTLQGVSENEMLPLKAPAGLDIQARRGDEIALSIMAEIVQQRRNAELLDLALLRERPKKSKHSDSLSRNPQTETRAQEEMAVDPICGMQVEVVSAKHSYEYASQLYFFCCAGCQTKFAKDPQQYIRYETPSGQALDLICHMSVDIATAKHMSEYKSQLYYFCCAGCKTIFDKDPVAYVENSASDIIPSPQEMDS
jgi:xanthine dehydrogenase accessory factor